MSAGAIAATIAALSIIIVVHELGHFAAAKAFRIPVEEFALGFGRPALAWFRRGETRYTLRPFLVGGFVKITGMEPDSTAENGFDRRPLWQRMAVVIAGSAMNLLLAVIVFIAMGLVVGKVVGSTSIIQRVLPDTPAARVGLRPGDRILAAGGVSGDWEKMRQEIRRHPGERIVLRVERGGQSHEIAIVPAPSKEPALGGTPEKPRYREVTVGLIGVVTRPITQPMGLGESAVAGVRQALGVVGMLAKAIGWTATGRLPAGKVFGGPVRVVGEIAEGYKLGWAWFVGIIAMLSFQIGLINLFPVPALDGSRAVFLVVEGIRRRPLDKRKEAMVHVVGFTLLIAALLLLTYHDILFYVTRQ